LSPYTSKVLGWKRPGRIDSCRLEKKTCHVTCLFSFTVSYLMTSSGPGCPATVPKGALRRIGTLVARRIEMQVYLHFD
ncbi:hypothetical protein, partial [uncultured Phascolarctobacterium sp.]|uniref:hypothetical protein n=1 Tax=uncultured Phascolarctobacterium sp. TaxID=512296 RepID=UPI0025F34C6A